MRYFIHTTLTNTHRYTQWTRPSDPNMSAEIIPDPVIIVGGANRATFPDSKFGRMTPKGVMTEVSEKQMEYLRGCWKFQRHLQKGFITVTNSKEDSEKIAKDMQPRDNSAPLTPDSAEFNKPDPQQNQNDGIVTKAIRVMKKAVN